MKIPIPLVIVLIGIISLGVFITVSGKKPQKERNKAKQVFFTKAYGLLSNFFVTGSTIRKIYGKISALSIFSKSEIQEQAAKQMIITSGVSIALVVASIVLFKDTISVLICIVFAIVMNNILVTKQIDKVNLKVYKALKNSIASVSQQYMRLGSVAEAIAEADIHKLLVKPFNEIHSIITGTEGEIKLLKFYESSPFRSLQTFAGVSFNIHNSGDDKDEYGQSNYLQALTMLTSDINAEITRLVTMKTKFGVIEYLTLIPVIGMPLLESYFPSIMPGTSLVYNGVLGYIIKVVTLVACIVCYVVIANINTATPIKDDDRLGVILRALRNRRFSRIIENIIPKNKKMAKLNMKMRSSLTRKSVQHIYAEKLAYSVIAFFAVLVTLISVISLSRTFMLKTTQPLSLVDTGDLDKYTHQQILELDSAYLNREEEMDDGEIGELIRSHLPGLSDLQLIDQVKRLKDKESSLNAAYFHWYYMVVVIGVTLLAWRIPDIMLKARTYMVKSEAEEDFLQLQTLMSILMNTEMDTLDVLWQMCQHSRVHKNILWYCYHGYPSNPEKELVRLQSRTPIIEFKRFISNISLTISNLSLREAFRDLKMEREYITELRKTSIYASIDRKRELCGKLAILPVIMLLIGYFLIPIGYLGIMEFSKAMGSMGAM